MTPADGPGSPLPSDALPSDALLASAPFPTAEEAADLRLVVVDMDGTLLDDDHHVDPSFWPVADELARRGVVLCAASGRQHATLARIFGPLGDAMVFIAENGAHVVRGTAQVSIDRIDRAVVEQAVRTVRHLAAGGADVGTVLSGSRSAYVERHDAAFIAEADQYYARLEQVDDLLAVDDDMLKIAVHDTGPVAQSVYPALGPLGATHTLVLSGEHWTDLTNKGTHKGAALERLQLTLGVTPAQTVAFGDHLNDLEMLTDAGMSFAMANGHPDVLAAARFRAPSNTENGVVRVLAELLRLAG